MRELLTELDSEIGNESSDPIQKVVRNLQPKRIKRFYKSVSISNESSGYWIRLDDKPIRSPRNEIIECTNKELATRLAEEWEKQDEFIDYITMPITRILNVAVDGVSDNITAVIDTVCSYASSDMICYRANGPKELVARQQQYWDPILHWLQQSFGLVFEVTTGILPVEQSAESIQKVKNLLQDYGSIQLAALHTVTTLGGSILLALALEKKAFEPEIIWQAINLDEDWNIEHWGQDAEALRTRKFKQQDFDAAVLILNSLNSGV